MRERERERQIPVERLGAEGGNGHHHDAIRDIGKIKIKTVLLVPAISDARERG